MVEIRFIVVTDFLLLQTVEQAFKRDNVSVQPKLHKSLALKSRLTHPYNEVRLTPAYTLKWALELHSFVSHTFLLLLLDNSGSLRSHVEQLLHLQTKLSNCGRKKSSCCDCSCISALSSAALTVNLPVGCFPSLCTMLWCWVSLASNLITCPSSCTMTRMEVQLKATLPAAAVEML